MPWPAGRASPLPAWIANRRGWEASGYRGRASRTVTISVSGVADQSFVRSGDYVIRVPLSRMNQGLQRANALGRVTNVVVS